jgi:YVTN family beta-propeller protein
MVHDHPPLGNATSGPAIDGSPPPPAPRTEPLDGLAWLRGLDWRQFEDLVAAAYRQQGYTVLTTAPGVDGGIDLILTREGERIFVQCKHWKAWQVGAPVVRELFGLVVANRASRGIVVTSGTFSREARAFARQSGTELLDGPALLALIGSGRATPPAGFIQNSSPIAPTTRPVAPTVPPTIPSGVPSCPICLSPMILRRARRGPNRGSAFWGCSRYPGCKGTLMATPTTPLAPARMPPQARGTRPAQRRQPQRKDARSALVGVLVLIVGLPLTVAVLPLALRMAIPPIVTPPRGYVPTAIPAARTPTTAATIKASTPPPSMGEQPMGIAVDGAGKLLYTANYAGGDLTVIDTASMAVVDTIDVPGQPRAIAIAGSTLYVADQAANKVYALDVKSRTITATFRTGRDPLAVAVDAKAGRLFVANGENRTIWSYSLASGKRVGTKASSAIALAVDSADGKLYAGWGLGVASAYRTRTLSLVSNAYVGQVSCLGVDSRLQRLYTVGDGFVTEHNLLTGRSRSIPIHIDAQSIAIDSSHRVGYVVDPGTGTVQAVSLK